LTFLEFAHTVVLMLWVGSLAGFALVVIPVLISSLPSRDLATRATMAILERTAFLGCGAGAFLLLTTLLMHLLSLRPVRATLLQMLLLLTMTGAAVMSQLSIAPELESILVKVPAALNALANEDQHLRDLARLQTLSLCLLLYQVAAGIGVMVFAVRRWYHYLPVKRDGLPARDISRDPRLR
jgi:hypothetical protein